MKEKIMLVLGLVCLVGGVIVSFQIFPETFKQVNDVLATFLMSIAGVALGATSFGIVLVSQAFFDAFISDIKTNMTVSKID